MASIVKPVARLIAHFASGAAIFATIAGISTGIDWFMVFLKGHGASEFTAQVLSLLSSGLMLLDALLVTTYSVMSAWRFLVEIYRNGG